MGIIISEQGNFHVSNSLTRNFRYCCNYELVQAIMNMLKHEVKGVFLLRVLSLCGQVFILENGIMYHFTACTLLYILFLFLSVISLETDNSPMASSFFWGENWSQQESTFSTPLTKHHRSWGGDLHLILRGFCFSTAQSIPVLPEQTMGTGFDEEWDRSVHNNN